ncbi:methionyl-tRNA formyltransferase [Bradyrhizobium sp. 83012]|uniref:Methionyl-tRNA formyltransferase n=1 Tax=Bradyrhizobium aeschynomenes TaxID=2734909 RepID=A0ABX2CN60_9BRAD|nr:formyltransferase family protein [Bradyrhizobium aeschynomenes]NPU69644.1 methionyl-tRNA formyltransferase [Bradyrhizobium aeschynomenes]
MLDTIILLTGSRDQQLALTELLKAHNPALAFRCAVTLQDLQAIGHDVLATARLLAFTTGVIVPADILQALGHGAYNFHPAPPDYPGWAPAHFAMYDGATRFGATAHVMEARVDCGAIIGVETFDIPNGVNVRGLEQMTFVRLAYLFWRMSRDLACHSGPLLVLPIEWSGIRSTRKMYAEMCNMPADIGPAEMQRRIHAFHDDFRGIPLTVTLHGAQFQLTPAAPAAAQPVILDAPALAMAS